MQPAGISGEAHTMTEISTTETEASFRARYDEAYRIAGEAGTRPVAVTDWGLFVSMPAPSGVGAFTWFRSHEQLVDFLQEHGPYMLANAMSAARPEWGSALERFRTSAAQIGDEACDTDLRQVAKDSVDPGQQLDWAGPVQELVSGLSTFAQDIRVSYFEQSDDSDDDRDDSEAPPQSIVDDQVEEFFDYLASYGY
jgi:hypothetical protein